MASNANINAMLYDDEVREHPYSTCCDAPASLDSMPTPRERQRIDTLPRISCANISSEDFLAQYEMTRTPVILEGCADDWPAKTEWTMGKLTKRFGDDDSMTWKMSTLDPSESANLAWMEIVEQWGQNRSVYIFDDLDHPGKVSIDDDYSWLVPVDGKDAHVRRGLSTWLWKLPSARHWRKGQWHDSSP